MLEAVVDDLPKSSQYPFRDPGKGMEHKGRVEKVDGGLRLEQPFFPVELKLVWMDLDSQQIAGFQSNKRAIK